MPYKVSNCYTKVHHIPNVLNKLWHHMEKNIHASSTTSVFQRIQIYIFVRDQRPVHYILSWTCKAIAAIELYVTWQDRVSALTNWKLRNISFTSPMVSKKMMFTEHKEYFERIMSMAKTQRSHFCQYLHLNIAKYKTCFLIANNTTNLIQF